MNTPAVPAVFAVTLWGYLAALMIGYTFQALRAAAQ